MTHGIGDGPGARRGGALQIAGSPVLSFDLFVRFGTSRLFSATSFQFTDSMSYIMNTDPATDSEKTR